MKEMLKRSLFLWLFFLHAAWGVGLGPMRIYSAIAEPFLAEVPLLGVEGQDLSRYSVGIGDQLTYEAKGVAYPDEARLISAEIRNLGERKVVRLTSRSPIQSPLFDLILEVKGASGRTGRLYTVAVPLPNGAPTVSSAPEPAEPVAKKRVVISDMPRRLKTAEPPAAPPVAAAPRSQSKNRIVQKKESLIGIARELQPSGLTLSQTMAAIYLANPHAFMGRNPNRLVPGSALEIPSEQEMAAIPVSKASALLYGKRSARRREVLAMEEFKTPARAKEKAGAKAILSAKEEAPEKPIAQERDQPFGGTVAPAPPLPSETADSEQPRQEKPVPAPTLPETPAPPTQAAAQTPHRAPAPLAETAPGALPAGPPPAPVPAAPQGEKSGGFSVSPAVAGALVLLALIMAGVWFVSRRRSSMVHLEDKEGVVVHEEPDEIKGTVSLPDESLPTRQERTPEEDMLPETRGAQMLEKTPMTSSLEMETTSPEQEEQEEEEQMEDAAEQIALARAYLNLGEMGEAKRLLAQVLQKGGPEDKKVAQDLLREIP